MKASLSRLALLLLVLLAAACASAPQSVQPVSRNSNRLTAEEISTVQGSDAFDVVRTLRPTWLRVRGASSLQHEGQIMVMVDGIQFGTVNSLRQIPVNTIRSMEFLDAASATQRWGSGYTRGAILVNTSR